MLALLIIATAVIGAVIYYLIQWSTQRSHEAFKDRGIPYIPLPNVLTIMIRKARTELIKDEIIKREKVKAFGFIVLKTKTIVVADPDITGQVLSKEFTNFINRRIITFNDPIFDSVLSNARDEQWKRLRSVVTPTFSTGSIRRMKPRIDDIIGKLLKNFESTLKEGSSVDVKRLYGAFTMDTIIQVAFGAQVDSLADPNNPIILNARKVFSKDFGYKTMAEMMIIFVFPKVAKLFGIRFQKEPINFFQDFSKKIIKKKKDDLQNNKGWGKASSFLELVLEAEAEHERQLMNSNSEVEKEDEFGFSVAKKYMTTQEMVAQCVLFFLAGYDTTATTITLATYLLALHPEEQDKLYQEIVTISDKLMSENPGKDLIDLITLDSLNRFEYLNGVICETLRLYAPATATERSSSRDVVLENSDKSIRINVKKGDIIHIPIYSMHRDPEQFPDPETFRPERFISDPSFHKYSYLPFGSGPRNCVAKSLALLEAKLALLHSVRNYRFSRCPQTKVPFELYYQDNFISPRDIILKVEKR